MKNIKALLTSLALICVTATPHAGGIPVIDVASITQAVLLVSGQAKELAQLIEQVKTAKSQLTEAQRTLTSLTGTRQMSALANMTGMRQLLPPEFMTATESIRTLGAAAASKDAKAIYATVKRFGCDQQFVGAGAESADMRRLCEVNAYAAPNTLVLVEQAVKRSELRSQSLLAMLKSIDTADSKAAFDLQNRIQLESAMLQNEKMLLDVALHAQRAQRELVAQQIKEEGLKRLSTRKDFDPFK